MRTREPPSRLAGTACAVIAAAIAAALGLITLIVRSAGTVYRCVPDPPTGVLVALAVAAAMTALVAVGMAWRRPSVAVAALIGELILLSAWIVVAASGALDCVAFD